MYPVFGLGCAYTKFMSCKLVGWYKTSGLEYRQKVETAFRKGLVVRMTEKIMLFILQLFTGIKFNYHSFSCIMVILTYGLFGTDNYLLLFTFLIMHLDVTAFTLG